MNRCIREPYVQWCERLSPSALAGGAVYSITNWAFFFFVNGLRCSFVFIIVILIFSFIKDLVFFSAGKVSVGKQTSSMAGFGLAMACAT